MITIRVYVTIKRMARTFIDEDLHLRMSRPYRLNLILADMGIIGAEVKHHGTARTLLRHRTYTARIVAHTARGLHLIALSTCRNHPASQSAITITNNADLLA